jgi:leucine dehydrogenase
LGGKYITAEDVGINTKDMEYVYMETKHVTGIPEWLGGSGDPSPVTAYGVYMGIKASAKKAYGSDSLSGKKILVQGVGHVGENLVKHLIKEGATVYINDIFEDKLKNLQTETGAQVVMGDSIYDLDIDIYAPCALGATLNDNTLNRLKAKIIAGAANNQLEDEKKHGQLILEKRIIYAPDFVINAGGLINVYSELQGYNKNAALSQAENIYNTTLNIFKLSEEKQITTHEAAKQIAEDRIAKVGAIRIPR